MLSTYNSLTKSNKSSLRDIISEIEPEKGPWGELLTLLRNCDEAFNESSAAITAKGLPLNRIACISHMLCDKKFLASVRIQLVCFLHLQLLLVKPLTALGVLVLNPCHMFLRRRVKLLLKESSFVSRSKRNIISMCWHLMFTMMKKKRKGRRV